MRTQTTDLARRRTAWRALLLPLLLFLAADLAGAADPAVEATVRRQDALSASGEKVKLLNEAKEAVAREDSALNRYLLGRAYGICEELEKAREQFDWALEKDATCAYAYHGLAVYYMLQGNLKAAADQFRTALKIDQSLTRAHTDLGKLYLMQGDNAAAELEFRRVLEYEPGNSDVRMVLAQHYLRRKKYDQATQEFQSLLRADPENRMARKGLALSLAFADRIDEAIREFQRVIGKNPKDYESYFFLERCQLKKEDRAGAVETLRKLLAAAPEGSRVAEEAAREMERVEKGPVSPPRPVTLQQVIEKLDSEVVEERREAMRVLLQLGVTPPPRRVLRAVKDKDVVVRVMAVKNAGAVGGARALGLLEVILLSPVDRDPQEEVRGAAVAGLAELRTAGALPVYLAALDDESLYVFRLAVKGLRKATGRLFVEDPEEPLIRSQRVEVTGKWREWWRSARAFSAKLDCIEELERIGNIRLGRYLAELMEDPDTTVVQRARKGFHALVNVQVGSDADVETPEGRARLRHKAMEVLERMKKSGK